MVKFLFVSSISTINLNFIIQYSRTHGAARACGPARATNNSLISIITFLAKQQQKTPTLTATDDGKTHSTFAKNTAKVRE